MYCTNCGTQVPDSSVFCHVCGAWIQQDAPRTEAPAQQPPTGQNPQPPLQHPKSNKGLIICLIVAIVAVVVASVVAIAVLRGRAESVPSSSADEPVIEQTDAPDEAPEQPQPKVDATSVEITAFENYTFDLDGDGDLETLRIENNDSENSWTFKTLVIYVDGQLAYEYAGEYGTGTNDYYDYRAITLSSGRTILYLYTPINNGDAPVCGLFRYNENTGTFEEAADLNAFFCGNEPGRYGNHVNGTFDHVDNDSIYINEFVMCWTAGTLDAAAQYRYNPDGTLELANAENLPVNSWAQNENGYLTLSYSQPGYATPDGKDAVATFRVGDRVTIESAYAVDGLFCLELKYVDSEDSYWVRCAEDYDDLPHDLSSGGTAFIETVLAG